MDHQAHVRLIRHGVVAGGCWADLGAGTGAFTLALADLLGDGGEIYAVDRDQMALDTQQKQMQAQFPTVKVHYQVADFIKALDLPPLDGVVMANSLHFVRNQGAILDLVRGYLKATGRLILVEYNADKGNQWVPYPLSFSRWQALAAQHGFVDTKLLATVPSRFLQEIYAALSIKID